MKFTNAQLDTTNAVWIDVNTLVGMNPLPDRIPDSPSISASSLINLLNCPIGARGRIFEPQYGSMLYHFLQEPVDEETAQNIQIAFIQAIGRWEPRITLDYNNTWVLVRPDNLGYNIRISYTVSLTGNHERAEFSVLANGN